MKVHLIKSPEYDSNEFNEIMSFVSSFDGPIEFIKHDFHFAEFKFPYLYKPRILFQLAGEPILKYDKIPKDRSEECKRTSQIFEYTPPDSFTKPISWVQIWDVCNYFRKIQNIPVDDFVVFLTDINNEFNWFSSTGPDKNIFVETNNWEYYIRANFIYPLSYQIIENILQYLMDIGPATDGNPYIHLKPIGCINDFCQDKSEVTLKLRTADICEICTARIIEQRIDQRILSQIRKMMTGIRNELLFSKQLDSVFEPVAIELSQHNELIFPAYGNQPIRLAPLPRALYVLFLLHHQGVRFLDLSLYRDDLRRFYRIMRPSASKDETSHRIEGLINPSGNTFNEVKSNINRTLTQLLGNNLAPFYRIEGQRSEAFKVNLPNHLINIRL